MSLFSIEAEQAVIGKLCFDGQLIDDVVGVVSPEDFYDVQNRMIFDAMLRTVEAGGEIELIGIAERLENVHPTDDWLPYLATLAKNTPGGSNIKLYAQKVAEYAKLRELFSAGGQVQTIANDYDLSVSERIAAAQDVIISLDDQSEDGGPRPVKELARKFVDHLDQCYKSKGGLTGLSTGFEQLDKRTGGLKPGQLITIAARPAMGKTQLALNLARNVGVHQKKLVLVFTMEMTSDELLGRLTSDLGNVDYDRVQRADFDETDRHMDAWHLVQVAAGKIRDARIEIDDSASISIGQIVSRARKVARRNPDLALIIVDHVGLVQSEGESEAIRVGRVSRALKMLAGTLRVPVVALSQLNRECEKRPNKRPILSDLRSSGDIEQDSDLVGFIYRDIVYNEDTKYPEIGEVIWRKVRAGKIGTDYFRTEFHFCRFVEIDKPFDIEEQPMKPYRKKVDL